MFVIQSTSSYFKRTSLAVLLCLLAACSTLQKPDKPIQPPSSSSKAAATHKQTGVTENEAIVWSNFPADSLYQLLTAELASQRGLYPKAQAIYQSQAESLQNAQLARRASLISKHLQDYPNALKSGLLWQKLSPQDTMAQQHLGYIYSRLGQFPDAFQAHQRQQQETGFGNYAGLAARSFNYPRQQAQLLTQLQTLSATQTGLSPAARLDLNLAQALLLNQNKQTQAALALLDELPRFSTTTQNPLQRLYIQALVLKAEIGFEQNQGKASLQELKDFTESHPDLIEARWHYARLLTRLDAEAGKVALKQLRQQAPANEQVLFGYARLLFLQRNFAQAAIEFRPLLFSPRFRQQALYHLALISAQSQEFEQAHNYLSAITPSDVFFSAAKTRAGIYLQQQQPQAAFDVLSKARQQEPANAVNYYLLQQDILNEQKSWQASFELLSQALKTFPDNIQLLYARSMVSEKRNQLALTEKDLRQILAKEPNNSLALNALGYTLADRTTRYQEALQLIKQAYQQHPDSAAILDSMGWVHYRLGMLRKARMYLEKALQSSSEPEIIAHYCEVLWFSQQQQKAQAIMQQALLKSPNHSILLRTVKKLGIHLETPKPARPNNGSPATKVSR